MFHCSNCIFKRKLFCCEKIHLIHSLHFSIATGFICIISSFSSSDSHRSTWAVGGKDFTLRRRMKSNPQKVVINTLEINYAARRWVWGSQVRFEGFLFSSQIKMKTRGWEREKLPFISHFESWAKRETDSGSRLAEPSHLNGARKSNLR